MTHLIDQKWQLRFYIVKKVFLKYVILFNVLF